MFLFLQSRICAAGSITNTKFPTVRFFEGLNLFCQDPILSKYSRIQRLHTLRITSCTGLCRLCTLTTVASTISGASSQPNWPNKKWFGFNIVSSLTSLLTIVRDLELNKLSALVHTVCNYSPMTSPSSKIAHITLLATWLFSQIYCRSVVLPVG